MSFFDEFSSLLEHVCIPPGNIIIIGDFNIRVGIPDDIAACKFNNLLGIFNRKQHVASSTHKNGHTLDLIITRCNDLSVSNVSVVDPGISDHSALLFNLSVSKPPLPRKEVTFCKGRNTDSDQFHQDLLSSPLLSQPALTLQDLCDQYDAVVSSLLDNHTPLQRKSIVIRPSAPWYSKEIAQHKMVG